MLGLLVKGIMAVQTVIGGVTLSPSGADIVATPAGAIISASSYRVYDFQRSTDAGATWNSVLLANFHYKTSGGTTSNTFKNYTTYGVTSGTPDADAAFFATGGQDSLGDIRTTVGDTNYTLGLGSAFDSTSWTVNIVTSIPTGRTAWSNLSPFRIEDAADEREVQFGVSASTAIFQGTAGAPVVEKAAPAVIPNNNYHQYSVSYNGSTIASPTSILLRTDGTNQTGGATVDNGTSGALTGAKSMFTRLSSAGDTQRMRHDKHIAAPWVASTAQQDMWVSATTTSQTLYDPLTNIGSGLYRAVVYTISGGAITNTYTSNSLSI